MVKHIDSVLVSALVVLWSKRLESVLVSALVVFWSKHLDCVFVSTLVAHLPLKIFPIKALIKRNVMIILE